MLGRNQWLKDHLGEGVEIQGDCQRLLGGEGRATQRWGEGVCQEHSLPPGVQGKRWASRGREDQDR